MEIPISAVYFLIASVNCEINVLLDYFNFFACNNYDLICRNSLVRHPEAKDPIINYQDPEKHETSLAVIPMFHAFGLSGILLGGLLVGNTIVTFSKFEPEPFLSAIQKYKVSVTGLIN